MKNMLLAFCCTLTIVLFSLSSTHAQQLKIGIFEMQRIMKESKVIQGYRVKLEQEIGTKRKQLDQKQDWIRSIEEKLRSNDKTITFEDRKKLSEKMAVEQRDLRRLREDVEAEIQKVDRELSEHAIREVGSIINTLAKEGSYDIIFERTMGGIAFWKDALDITQTVITIYDKKK
jgi:outer membrane protein